MSTHYPWHLLVKQQANNEDDQPRMQNKTHRFTWKTLQGEGKYHGHQPVTTSLFLECLQECQTDGGGLQDDNSLSKTLITVL
jgi:hypothetical protein